MTEMKKVNRLQRKPKIIEFNIEGETVPEQISVRALKVKDADLITKMGSSNPEESLASIREILKLELANNGYDINITNEEIDEIDWEYADAIISEVLNLNNVNMSEAKLKFIEDMKEKQKKAGIIKG